MADRTNPQNKAAYGGPGWSPRTLAAAAEIGTLWSSCGIDSEFARLKSVLMHRPGNELLASHTDFNKVQMLDVLDVGRAQAQHDALVQAYRDHGVTVFDLGHPGNATPNQMFMADVFVMTPEGAIVARPASTIRAGEERWASQAIGRMGMPITKTIGGHGTFEGADLIWITPKLALVARGLRTNDEGFHQIEATLHAMGVRALQIQLPYGSMHLMGMLRILDNNLALCWQTRISHVAVDVLRDHGYEILWVPDEVEARDGFAFNMVTLGPRKVMTPSGNPISRKYYEDHGVECVMVDVSELGKASGAIGCLTGIIERELMANL